MKRNILSLAVAAGLAGVAATATAQLEMHVNDKGLGEALIFPFYSAENGNDTYIHVVNTTMDSKAVKIRVIEGKNSVEVLDFNLYMSPEDHFSFVITETADGEGAMLRTADNSCTAPAIPAEGQPFVNFQYDGDSDDSLARTKVGYVEVFEMGQIEDGSVIDVDITHDSAGEATCSEVIKAWSTGGEWLADEEAFFQDNWNGGGLYGVSTVVNPEDAFAVGVDAIAIDDLVIASSGGAFHTDPGNLAPNWGVAGVNPNAVIFVDGGTQSFSFDDDSEGRHDAVSSLFMTATMANDFVLDDGRLSATDWVVTMPTKRDYVNGRISAREPFANVWSSTRSQACEPFALDLWNREESNVTITTGPQFSPKPDVEEVPDFVFCYESGVLQMGDRPAIGPEAGTTVVDLADNVPYAEGWARVSFLPEDLNDPTEVGTRTIVDRDGKTITGLPVTGFSVTKLYNSQAKEGVEAFYAAANNHKSTVVTSPVVR